MKLDNTPVVFYDGACGLCDWSVRFILKHEEQPELMFAALDSDFARQLNGNISSDSILLYHPELGVLQKSDALLVISNYLKRPWRWLNIFKLVPKQILDRAYDLVARNRYRFNTTIFKCALQSSGEFEKRNISD